MLFINRNDVDRCAKIVREELHEKNIVVGENILKKITEDIMNISYSKGGDYSSDIIKEFAKGYIETGLYKKYLA